eukprot:m.27296 g.27296  ORF g.27296 m.27296 type:complete len:147 (+) comp29920_c0_seq1:228-668(+)
MDDDILLGSELRDDDDDGNDQEVKEASGDDDDDDDPVVQEIDVFLSRKLSDNLCVLQFPLRPADRPFVSTHSTATARIKPKQQKVLQYSAAEETPCYRVSLHPSSCKWSFQLTQKTNITTRGKDEKWPTTLNWQGRQQKGIRMTVL